MTAPADQPYSDWAARRRHYPFDDNYRKKPKLNESDSMPPYYPFQAELTQKIDIECGSNAHPPTHHFTLSTVINVSVNGQSPQVPSPSSRQPYPSKSSASTWIPYSDVNLRSYLKDLDLSTLDLFSLPSCPNPQDYLTVDGLLAFLLSDTNHQSTHPIHPPCQDPRASSLRSSRPNSYATSNPSLPFR